MPTYLIVGAGAVGQPLAYHLHRGGASVAFLVKEKYAAELRQGPLTVEWLSMVPCRGSSRALFREYSVFTTINEAAVQQWDAIFLTVASPALREGTWLQELVDTLIKPCCSTALVFLTSAMCDGGLFERCEVPAPQLVQGGITFISWQAPLPNERFRPVEPAGASKSLAAIGYVLPSFVLSGPKEHALPLAKLMTVGGMSCSVLPNVEAEIAFGEATLMPFLVALEAQSWSFHKLRRSGLLSLTAAAVRECLAVAQIEAGSSRLWRFLSALFMHGWMFWFLLIIAPRVMPFDLEAFLKYHFLKVGDQTKQYIDDFISHGRKHGGNEAMANVCKLIELNSRWKKIAS